MLFLPVVIADLPVHCTQAEVIGEWIFHIGRYHENGKVDTRCGYRAPDSATVHTHLTPRREGDPKHVYLTDKFKEYFDINVVLGDHRSYVVKTNFTNPEVEDLKWTFNEIDLKTPEKIVTGSYTLVYDVALYIAMQDNFDLKTPLFEFVALMKYIIPVGGNPRESDWKVNQKNSQCDMTLLGHVFLNDKIRQHMEVSPTLCFWGEKISSFHSALKTYPEITTFRKSELSEKMMLLFHSQAFQIANQKKKKDQVIPSIPRQILRISIPKRKTEANLGFTLILMLGIVFFVISFSSDYLNYRRHTVSQVQTFPKVLQCTTCFSLTILVPLFFVLLSHIVVVKDPPKRINKTDSKWFDAVEQLLLLKRQSRTESGKTERTKLVEEEMMEAFGMQYHNNPSLPGFGTYHATGPHRDLAKSLERKVAKELGITTAQLLLEHIQHDSRPDSKAHRWTNRKYFIDHCVPLKKDEASEEEFLECVSAGFEKNECNLDLCSWTRDEILADDWRNTDKLSFFDWRYVILQTEDGKEYQNFVLPVPEQGECGSCYAVSSSSMLTSRLMIRYPELHEEFESGRKDKISVQEILECSYLNQGCHGGWPFFVALEGSRTDMHTVKEYARLKKEKKNCLREGDEGYDKKRSREKGFRISTWSYLGGQIGSCGFGHICADQMQRELLQGGPIFSALKAAPEFWSYRGGVLRDVEEKKTPAEKQFNNIEDCHEKGLCYKWEDQQHAMMLTGWGEDFSRGRTCEPIFNDDQTKEDRHLCNSKKTQSECAKEPSCEWRGFRYWIYQNSWGQWWGEDGYLHIGPRGGDPFHIESVSLALDAFKTNDLLEAEEEMKADIQR